MERNQTKLISNLERFKSLDADLGISKQETKECVAELEAVATKSLRCQSEYDSNLKTILNLKTNQSKLISDLENLKRTDADLVMSQQETDECIQKLDVETKKSVQYQSENDSNQKIIHALETNQTKLTFELGSVDADLIIAKQETKKCAEELEAETKKSLRCKSENDSNLRSIIKLKANHTKLISEAQKSQNLEAQNSILMKSVEALTKENEESEIKIEELEEKVANLKLENEITQKQNEDSISNLEEFERERNATIWMNSILLDLSELTCHQTNEKLLNLSMNEKEQCVERAQDFAREGILSNVLYVSINYGDHNQLSKTQNFFADNNFSVRWYRKIILDNE